jgi:hypothetical protein
MAGKGLNHFDRRATHGESRDVGMTEGVEIGHPSRGVNVGDAGGGQVAPDHHGGVFGQVPEHGPLGRL